MPSKKQTAEYSVDGIQRIAEKVRALSETLEPREKLEEIVTNFGGKIQVSEIDGGESLVVNDNGFTIFISPLTSPQRDNFTIAHELGHLILHTNHTDAPDSSVEFGRYGQGRQEVEANRFAAELLMPLDQFIEVARENENNEYLLAARFGVSVAAARVRIASLKSEGKL